MNIVRATHQLATEMSVLARFSLAKGFEKEALEYYKQAYLWECKAAFMTAPTNEDKDAHFILLRSAAALAFKAELYKESERLIEVCRSANPPVYILEDLKEIADLIKGKQRIKQNINTADSSIQLNGILTKVNADENEITIKDVLQAKNFAIIVPRHLLVDIAKQYLLDNVQVEARQTVGGTIVLESISKAA